MTLKELAPPDGARLPLDLLRDYLRLGRGFGDDAAQDPVLETCLRGAMRAIEARLSQALLVRDYRWILYLWRGCDRLDLPVAPVESIAQMAIVTAAGVTTVLPPISYQLAHDSSGAFLSMLSGSFPTLATGARVEVDLRAGYGEWADIPAELQQAWLRLAASFYEDRHDATGGAPGLPAAVLALLEPHLPRRTGRVWR